MSEIDALEAYLMTSPQLRAEVERLAKSLPKLSLVSFLALTIAMRHESERRVTLPLHLEPRRVGIGNR